MMVNTKISSNKMPLMGHVAELRSRIVKSLAAILIFFLLAFFFSTEIINYLKQPLIQELPEQQKNLYFTGPLDVFIVSIKSSFLVAFIVSCPVWFYQFWSFLAPALYEKEKKYIKPFIIASVLLFFVGVLFCYYIIIPLALEFLLKIGFEVGVPVITITDYFSLLSLMIIGFGVIFELPLILLLLGFLNIIDESLLAKYRRYVIVLSLIVAAILTPPDPMSQIGLALPLYIMYEVSIVILRLFNRRRKRGGVTS